MKVLQINKYFYKKGGSETYFFALRKLLKQAGHQVIDFSMQDNKNEQSEYSDYFIKKIDFTKKQGFWQDLKKAFHLLYSAEAAHKLEQLIKQEQPDIAHLHNFYWHLTPSIINVLKKHNIPVVWTLHDYKLICPNYRLFTQNKVCQRCKGGKYYNCLINKCIKNNLGMSFLAMVEMYLHKTILKTYNKVDLYIAPSKFMAEKIIEWGIDENKVVQQYYFIDNKMLKYQGSEIGSDLLYFGRLSPEKGIMTLLKSMQKIPQMNLKIIGHGPQLQQISDYIIDNKMENVKVLGHKTGQELFDIIVQSKFVIVPSIWYENNPMSLMEAMGMGKVVIGSEIGGIPELIDNEHSGFLFKPADSDDLALILAKNNPDIQLQGISQNAHQKIVKIANQDQHLENIIYIYKDLLK